MCMVRVEEKGRAPKGQVPILQVTQWLQVSFCPNPIHSQRRFKNEALQWLLPSEIPRGVKRQQAQGKKRNVPLVACTLHARHLAENHVTGARKGPARQSSGMGTSHCPLFPYRLPATLSAIWSLECECPASCCQTHLEWATSNTKVQKPWSILLTRLGLLAGFLFPWWKGTKPLPFRLIWYEALENHFLCPLKNVIHSYKQIQWQIIFIVFSREFSYFSLIHNILRVENIYRSCHNITNDSFKR